MELINFSENNGVRRIFHNFKICGLCEPIRPVPYLTCTDCGLRQAYARKHVVYPYIFLISSESVLHNPSYICHL